MRPVPQKMTDGWKREDKTGDYRPTVRATIQRLIVQQFPYDTARAEGGDFEHQRFRKGYFSSALFGEDTPPIELRGITSCSWERSLDQDVATCTLTIKNSELKAMQSQDQTPNQFDAPGEFTPNRGITWDAWGAKFNANQPNPWGYTYSWTWSNLLIPDRLVKTYEGYGADYSKYPDEDPNLMISGTWVIDKVTYDSEGDITLEMRDLGRMLLTQIVYPPNVPAAEYPMSWSRIRTEEVPARDVKGGKWVDLKGKATATSSNEAYIGKGLTDPPFPYYVSNRGHVNGHHPKHALDSENRNVEKYWMSTGQPSRNATVWWQINFNNPQDVAGIRIDPVAGPYRIYISVQTASGWVGRKIVPHNTSLSAGGVANGARIPFVQAVWADRWDTFDVAFLRKYKGVRKIRLSFTKLSSVYAGNYPWRAMLKDVKVYVGDYNELHFGKGTKLKSVGNYRDYSHIVKWMCAWGGFYWPPAHTGKNYWYITDKKREYVRYDFHDPTFPDGRAWGTYQGTATFGEADLTVDLFDKKPFMDVINYIRDITGFVFFVDEWGGPIWRMPNLYEAGNYLAPRPTTLETRRQRLRTNDFVTIDEKDTLLSYSTVLDSENIRERIFVANATGKIGSAIRGFTPTSTGLRRVAGWTDQNFKTTRETLIMADMIAAQQMFNWRRTRVQTPGYPAIQLDDQIRIYERVTNETYFHYVLGISSNLDMTTGEWTYDLNTHWLGPNRSSAWVIDKKRLSAQTQSYLNELKGTAGSMD